MAYLKAQTLPDACKIQSPGGAFHKEVYTVFNSITNTQNDVSIKFLSVKKPFHIKKHYCHRCPHQLLLNCHIQALQVQTGYLSNIRFIVEMSGYKMS